MYSFELHSLMSFQKCRHLCNHNPVQIFPASQSSLCFWAVNALPPTTHPRFPSDFQLRKSVLSVLKFHINGILYTLPSYIREFSVLCLWLLSRNMFLNSYVLCVSVVPFYLLCDYAIIGHFPIDTHLNSFQHHE